MALYVITDWLGLFPVAVSFAFGLLGLKQLLQLILPEAGANDTDFTGDSRFSRTQFQLAGYIVKIGPGTIRCRQHAFGPQHHTVGILLF